MDQCSKPATAHVHDLIEHDLLPGFRMAVLDAKDCEVDGARPEPHRSFKVVDPEGNRDWVCAYDVHPA